MTTEGSTSLDPLTLAPYGRPVPGSPVPLAVRWLVVASSVAVLGGFSWSRVRHDRLEALHALGGRLGAEEVDRPALPFDLPTLDGGRVRLGGLRGRVVVLLFWATWCPPCRTELPALRSLAGAMAGRPFELVAVSQDEEWDAVRELLGPRPPGYTVALDPGGALALSYGTEKLPEAYVVGRDGRVVARFVNVQPWGSADMLGWLEQVVASGL